MYFNASATKMDPTLQMVHTCGYLAGLDIDVHLKASAITVLSYY